MFIFFFNDNETYYPFYWVILYLFCKQKSQNKEYKDRYIDFNGKTVQIDKYISDIKTNDFYSGDFEISESVNLFKINILVFRKVKYNNNIEYEFLIFLKIPILLIKINF